MEGTNLKTTRLEMASTQSFPKSLIKVYALNHMGFLLDLGVYPSIKDFWKLWVLLTLVMILAGKTAGGKTPA